MNDLLQAMRARADEFIGVRRDIHRHPELAFDEHRTAQLVAERLERWGYRVERGIGGTGVVGTLVRGHGSRRLGIRADMDALPIDEASGAAWSSVHAGVMHACGHDGHTAMLLAAAQHLAERCRFDGTLHLIFQPAEEGGGGALRMMDDGLFDRFPCDAVFAMHNMPGIEPGHFVLRDGPAMASSDYVTITIDGTGGHGAMPHRAADPVVAAASIVMALQTIVARNVPPLQTAIVTVGAFLAGDAPNVIPGSAELRLTVRAMRPDIRDLLERRIAEIAQAQAASYGATAEVRYIRRYPVLNNTPEHTAFCLQLVRDWLGDTGVVTNPEPVTASEDFSFFLEKVPGCFINIGNGTGSQGGCMVHNAGYDFNDRVLSTGATYWVKLVERWLATQD